MPTPQIVGVEMAVYDRPSFDDWYPQHLRSVLELVDALYLRIDHATYGKVIEVLQRTLGAGDVEVLEAAAGMRLWGPNRAEVIVASQHTEYGRWQEDAERQALLDWALNTGAEWAVCFDADEVIEPGGGAALRQLLLSDPDFRLLKLTLSYSSHHRPGYVVPRGGFQPWRAFRLDQLARVYKYESDCDGLHCGSVPFPPHGGASCPDLRVMHYHATTCEEFMAERAFYAGTTHVDEHGGIDWLYRCDRFGDERQAVPLYVELAGAEERLARVADGSGLVFPEWELARRASPPVV